MNADALFAALVLIAWPAACAYPLLYATRVKWWRTWVGQALLLKALGVWILLTVSALYQMFGPGYWSRDVFRLLGMALVAAGVWYALVAMLREFRRSERATR